MSEIINWFDNDKNKHETLVLTSGDTDTTTGVLVSITQLNSTVDDISNPASEMKIEQLAYPYPLGGNIPVSEVSSYERVFNCTFWTTARHTAYLRVVNNTRAKFSITIEFENTDDSMIYNSLVITGEVDAESSTTLGLTGYYRYGTGGGGSVVSVSLKSLRLVPRFD